MRILLSVFSCAPGYGSEPGVGWNWAVQLARLGHEVTALTETTYRDAIGTALAREGAASNLAFEFFMPPWLGRLRGLGWRLGYPGLTEHLVHLVWQYLACRHARRRFQGEDFDIVHHVTYGGIRHPTFMGALPYPLVLGPLGGGERAPLALRRGLSWRGWLSELVRDAHTFLIRLDPITLRACAQALVVYVKTAQSCDALPRRFHHKIALAMEIGIGGEEPPPPEPRSPDAPLRLLYAGRFLSWKGMHLGLRALAAYLASGGRARLTMLGGGPDERRWRALARELGIEEAIEWLGWVPHARMGELYRAHDALLFPSLHDSSGNAILESLAHGLPVICLDLGGPGAIVDESCGRVVATHRRSEQACVAALAGAIEQLGRSPALCAELGEGARARARHFRWPGQVARVYDDLARRLERRPGRVARVAEAQAGGE